MCEVAFVCKQQTFLVTSYCEDSGFVEDNVLLAFGRPTSLGCKNPYVLDPKSSCTLQRHLTV